MSPKQLEKHVKHRIAMLNNLAVAVDDVVEGAEPIYSGNDGEPMEYVIDAVEYQRMFDCLIALKKERK